MKAKRSFGCFSIPGGGVENSYARDTRTHEHHHPYQKTPFYPFAGPPWPKTSRVMRTAFFLVWVSRKHSEQVARQHGK